MHCGVFVRSPCPGRLTCSACFDDMEMQIAAQLSNRRVTELMDSMSDDEREGLVGAGSQGYHFGEHVLLGWVGTVPEKYDEQEVLENVKCHSFIVEELPKSLRERLDPGSRGAALDESGGP
jgi:hypothetical protein